MRSGCDTLVSIIIPCYNAERYVAEAIESALSQTYPHCEVIVIDDGSTDGSLAVIQGYGERIRWRTGRNRGGCAARNLGLEMAKGKWIQFLDADDKMTPRKIELQVSALEDEGAGVMAVSPVRVFDHTGFVGPLHWVDHWHGEIDGVGLVVEMLLHEVWLNPHCWLTPIELIRERGGWLESLAAGQDMEFFGRVVAGARKVIFVTSDETIAYYRLPRDGNVSTDRSYRSCKGSFDAWDAVQKIILSKRSDRDAQRAVIRHLRGVALVASRHPEIIDEVVRHEKRLNIRDFNFRSSIKRGLLFGVLGIEGTLKLRRLFGRK